MTLKIVIISSVVFALGFLTYVNKELLSKATRLAERKDPVFVNAYTLVKFKSNCRIRDQVFEPLDLDIRTNPRYAIIYRRDLPPGFQVRKIRQDCIAEFIPIKVPVFEEGVE